MQNRRESAIGFAPDSPDEIPVRFTFFESRQLHITARVQKCSAVAGAGVAPGAKAMEVSKEFL